MPTLVHLVTNNGTADSARRSADGRTFSFANEGTNSSTARTTEECPFFCIAQWTTTACHR